MARACVGLRPLGVPVRCRQRFGRRNGTGLVAADCSRTWMRSPVSVVLSSNQSAIPQLCEGRRQSQRQHDRADMPARRHYRPRDPVSPHCGPPAGCRRWRSAVSRALSIRFCVARGSARIGLQLGMRRIAIAGLQVQRRGQLARQQRIGRAFDQRLAARRRAAAGRRSAPRGAPPAAGQAADSARPDRRAPAMLAVALGGIGSLARARQTGGGSEFGDDARRWLELVHQRKLVRRASRRRLQATRRRVPRLRPAAAPGSTTKVRRRRRSAQCRRTRSSPLLPEREHPVLTDLLGHLLDEAVGVAQCRLPDGARPYLRRRDAERKGFRPARSFTIAAGILDFAGDGIRPTVRQESHVGSGLTCRDRCTGCGSST